MAEYDYRAYWTMYYPSQHEGWYIKEILDKVEEYHPKKILELGSGLGHTSKKIKERFPNCHLTGIDVVKDNEYLDFFLHADLSLYDSDLIYDCIIAQNVLLHIKPAHIHSLIKRMHVWSENIVVLDYDPKISVKLADHNFRHDFSVFPNKVRVSDTNSIWYT